MPLVARMEQRGIRGGTVIVFSKPPPRIPACGLHPGYEPRAFVARMEQRGIREGTVIVLSTSTLDSGLRPPSGLRFVFRGC